MFFEQQRLHFFRPLCSKYRQQVVQCLALLYNRQFGSSADYGEAVGREQMLEILQEALQNSKQPVFDDQDDDLRFRGHKEQASWVMKQLIECGWIECQVDNATLVSSYPFSRMGRIFAQALVESDVRQIKTRHRNTRNTLNALNAYDQREDIYDLLDAFDCSERIITDFTDIITELEEQKRDMVREVESQQLVQKATDQFFDFMEARFKPDIAVRLSADSVEKYREDIQNSIDAIRHKPRAFKKQAEARLRAVAPGLCDNKQSYLWYMLDGIESRMQNAAEIMLPALRRALHSFTKRADIIIRQLSYLNHQRKDNLVDVLRQLAAMPETTYKSRMANAADLMSGFNLRLLDPEHMRLQHRRTKMPVITALNATEMPNDDVQQSLYTQRSLDQAFGINHDQMKAYIQSALQAQGSISNRDLPIQSATDLIAMNHITELASVNTDEAYSFRVKKTDKVLADHPYFSALDEFIISLEKNRN